MRQSQKEGNRRRCVHKIVSKTAERPFRQTAYCGRQVRTVYEGEVNCLFCLKFMKRDKLK